MNRAVWPDVFELDQHGGRNEEDIAVEESFI